jgi:hypothetical protein
MPEPSRTVATLTTVPKPRNIGYSLLLGRPGPVCVSLGSFRVVV